MVDKAAVKHYLLDLQNRISVDLAAVDGREEFVEDSWTRPEGGAFDGSHASAGTTRWSSSGTSVVPAPRAASSPARRKSSSDL